MILKVGKLSGQKIWKIVTHVRLVIFLLIGTWVHAFGQNITISSATTSNISSSTSGGVVTYSLTNTGAVGVLNVSDIQTQLNAGNSVTVLSRRDITVSSSISVNPSSPVSLTLESIGGVSSRMQFGSGLNVTSTGSPLSVALKMRTQNGGHSASVDLGNLQVTTNGGNFTTEGVISFATGAAFNLNGASINTGAGNLSLTAQSYYTGTQADVWGVKITGSSSLTTSTGNITIIGELLGASTNTSPSSRALLIDGSSIIQTTGSGTLTLKGEVPNFNNPSVDPNYILQIATSGSISSGGALTVTGNNLGSTSTVTGAIISSNLTSSGAMQINGTDIIVAADLNSNSGNGDITLSVSGALTLGSGANRTINAGSGNVTIVAESPVFDGNATNTTMVTTTGRFTLAPYEVAVDGFDNVATQIEFQGTISGGNFTGTGDIDGLVLTNLSTLGGLTIGAAGGDYSSGSGYNVQFDAGIGQIGINGPFTIYGNNVIVNSAVATPGRILVEAGTLIDLHANLTSTSTTGTGISLNGQKINHPAGVSVTTSGSNIDYLVTNSPWTSAADAGISLNSANGSKATINAQGGNVVLNSSFATTGINNASAAHMDFGILIVNTDILTNSTGSISINGDIYNNASTTGAFSWGVDLRSGTVIRTASGNINITGRGGKSLSNARGVVSNNTSLSILSNSGTITLTDRVPAGNEVNYTGMYFRPSSNFAIKFGSDGTLVSSSTSSINLLADKITFDFDPTQVTTSGTVTIAPAGTSFASELITTYLDLSSSIGQLVLGKADNLGNIEVRRGYDIAGPINVYGGTIAINSNLTTTNGTTGDVLIQGSSISGTGNILLASGRTATINISSSGTYGGIISGTTAGLTKAGLGTLTLSGTNTYTGTTTVSAGTLQLGRSNAIPNTALSLSAGATLALAGFNQEVATVSGTGTINSSTGTPTFACGSANSNSNFGGVIGTGNITLIKEGTAQLVLSGVNTYTGNTIINGGTLRIGNNGSIGAGTPAKTYSGNITINSGTFEFGSSTDHLFSGVISGSGNLSIRTNPNFPNVSLTLTGQNTYTGLTTVGNTGTSAGVLKLNRNGGGTIPATNNITISDAAGTLEVSSAQTLNNLTFNNGAKLVVNNGVSLTVAGSFSGTNSIDNNGTIIITGSSAFPGSSTINAMNNLTINNSTGVTLNNDLTVAGTLTLSSGVFDAASNMLTVTGSITGGSSSSYIKTSSTGRLKMSVANSANKIFPVGNSSYNPLTITNNTGLADDFSVRVADEVLDGGTTGTAITDKVLKRTWHIVKTNPNVGSGVNMTFQWAASEEGTNMTDYKLSHYGNAWALAAGTSGAVSGTTTKTMTHTGYTGTFSPFAIGSSASVLPVTWLNFTGKKVTQGVELNWSTSSEQNTKDFQVQHSINAQQWTSVGNMPAAGNSNAVRNYRFVHEGPFKNSIQHYYRILQRDLDGKFSYSKVIRIEYPDAATDVVLYPNPASDVLHINITERQELRLVNMQGVVVWKGVLPAGRHEIPVSSFAAGNYILQAGKGTYKVMIQ